MERSLYADASTIIIGQRCLISRGAIASFDDTISYHIEPLQPPLTLTL